MVGEQLLVVRLMKVLVDAATSNTKQTQKINIIIRTYGKILSYLTLQLYLFCFKDKHDMFYKAMVLEETVSQVSSQDTDDELFLRKNVKYWRQIFQQYDKNGDGDINVKELDDLIHSKNCDHDIPKHVVVKIHELADSNSDGRLDFHEFIDMVHNPNWQPLFGHLINRYVNMIIPRRPEVYRMDPEYDDEYSCYPPPVGMLLISLIEIILYCIDATQGSTLSTTGPIATVLIYDPYRRYEAWRYVTYMFVHIGLLHLVVNLSVQVLLGAPLELVHRWWRVLFVYFAGVIAGSLGASITDPEAKLAGSSGGVYAVITAHVSSIIMNWKEMEYPLVQLIIFITITGADIGTAIYNRYILDIDEQISYSAHFAGALAGLLVGINILRNIVVRHVEHLIWWISIITYIALMGGAIVWNAAYTDYFLLQNYSNCSVDSLC